jgi:hypothetical protein
VLSTIILKKNPTQRGHTEQGYLKVIEREGTCSITNFTVLFLWTASAS